MACWSALFRATLYVAPAASALGALSPALPRTGRSCMRAPIPRSLLREELKPTGRLRQGKFCKGLGSTRQRRALSARASAAEGSEEGAARPSVGFLGMGIMGVPMAKNLVKAGFDVTVWNRSAAKCQPLLEAGAKQGATPQEVAAACDVTFAMLADPTAAVDVACGDSGAVQGLGKGKGYVDISTVDGATAKDICSAVRATGAEYLEAPVSGSKKPAEDGTLIFLTAGDKALFERVSEALDAMGKSKFYLGEVGNGAAMKLVVNMVMGSMMAAFSEGLVLGEKAGLDPATILQVISQGAIAAPMYAMKGPAMLSGSFPPAFPLKHQQKDLRLALELGGALGQPLPVAASANGVFESGKGAGLGDEDFSAVLLAVRGQQQQREEGGGSPPAGGGGDERH